MAPFVYFVARSSELRVGSVITISYTFIDTPMAVRFRKYDISGMKPYGLSYGFRVKSLKQ